MKMATTEVASTTRRRSGVLGYLSLFTSLGTLLCCALPSLLVLFGLGTTVATILSIAPWLVTLSRHKIWVFATSGVLIIGNFVYVYFVAPKLKESRPTCSADDASCQAATRF